MGKHGNQAVLMPRGVDQVDFGDNLAGLNDPNEGIVIEPMFYTDMSLFSQLPDDIWIEVFQNLNSSADLYHIIQCCSLFYSLGFRSLYRHIHYEQLRHFEHNTPFWLDRQDAIQDVTRSLSFGPTFYLSLQQPVEIASSVDMMRELLASGDLDGNGVRDARRTIALREARRERQIRAHRTSFQRRMWFTEMSMRIVSFPHLRRLSFEGMTLAPSLYTILTRLPNLRDLSLVDCALNLPEHGWEFTLPITTLTIHGLRWHWEQANFPRNRSFAEDTFDLIATAKSQLRELRMNWTSTLSRAAIQDAEVVLFLPSTLEILELDPCSEKWLTALFACLAKSGVELRTLRIIPSMLPLNSGQTLPRSVLPPDLPEVALPMLKVFDGPVKLVSVLEGNKALERLALTSLDGVEGLTTALGTYAKMMKCLGMTRMPLRELCLTVKSWDVEIMHCVVQLFPDIVSLSVQYGGTDYPDANTLTMLGGEFLDRLRWLEVLELFNTNSISASSGSKKGEVKCLSPVQMLENIIQLERLRLEEEERGVGEDSYRLESLAGRAKRMQSLVDAGPSGGVDAHEFLAAWRRYTPKLREVRLVKYFRWRRVREDSPINGGEGKWGVWCKSFPLDEDLE